MREKVYTELLVVLRYRRDSDAFDVSLSYDGEGPVDSISLVERPLAIDVGALGELIGDMEQYGDALSSTLFSGEIRSFYDRAMAVSGTLPISLKILVDPRAPRRYHSIVWESLREPATQRWLATSRNVRLSRYLSSPDWRPITLPPKREQTALVVVANPTIPPGYGRVGGGAALEPIKVEREVATARASLEGLTVNVKVLARLPGADGPPTLQEIVKTVENADAQGGHVGVDILYLVCHGGLDGDEARLYLEDDVGGMDIVDGSVLADRLADLEDRPALIVLSSCQSAGEGEAAMSSDGGALSALGPRLAWAGVASVVAMQGNVSMVTASKFLATFFAALGEGEGVIDRAMAVARGSVVDRERDWWVPVLYTRLRTGKTWYTPEFTARGRASFNALVTAVVNGMCLPVIGSGVAGESLLPSREEFAADWADRWQMPIAPQNRRDLAKVAQFLGVWTASNQPRYELRRYLITEFRKKYLDRLPDDLRTESDPDPQALVQAIAKVHYEEKGTNPFTLLADLDLPIYVTTSWTSLLEDALTAGGRTPTVLDFEWYKDGRAGDQADITIDRKHPLVYHLFGRISEVRSLVLTEDHYFQWLRAWIHCKESADTIPQAVTSALTESSLLFLGYRLDDWEFRVLFESIRSLPGSVTMADNVHLGVQVSPNNEMIGPDAAQEYLEEYFDKPNISVYWGTSESFLTNLANGVAAARV